MSSILSFIWFGSIWFGIISFFTTIINSILSIGMHNLTGRPLFNHNHETRPLFSTNELLQFGLDTELFQGITGAGLSILQILCGYYINKWASIHSGLLIMILAISALLPSLLLVLQIMVNSQTYIFQILMLLCSFCCFNSESIFSYPRYFESSNLISKELDHLTSHGRDGLFMTIFIIAFSSWGHELYSSWMLLFSSWTMLFMDAAFLFMDHVLHGCCYFIFGLCSSWVFTSRAHGLCSLWMLLSSSWIMFFMDTPIFFMDYALHGGYQFLHGLCSS